MQIQSIKPTDNKQTFSGFMNSKLLIKGLEKASDNGALFCSGTALILSSLRPLAIMSTPNVEKENKQFACAKSVASSIVNFGLIALITAPVVSAVKNIQDNPKKYLTNKTIKSYKNNAGTLAKSSAFSFATQFFKLGSGLLTVVPKTFLTCALIPPIVSFLFNKNKDKQEEFNQISFKGIPAKTSVYKNLTDKLSDFFAKILNSDKMQKISNKYKDTSLAQHMFSASDVLATGLFVNYTKHNDKIKKKNQKSLIYNASISTGLTIAGGYLLNAILKNPTQMFIDKFKQINSNLPTVDKCVDGIKNVKAAFILGGMYYLLTPMLATYLAGNLTKGIKENKQ